MNYTLNQLRIFKKVSETCSITKAADELHLTQPAVSIQIRNFQQQFDLPLIEIINKKLYLTDFGKQVALTAENILNEVKAIDYSAGSYKGKLFGRLKLSVVSTGKYVIPYFLSDFLKMHEGVELTLDVTNKAKVIESLENNEVDFSLVSVLPEHLRVNKVELMQNKLFLVGNMDRQFTKRSYDMSILQEVPLIYREKGSGTRYVMQRFLQKNKLDVKMKMELTSNESVKQALIAGLGYSIMPLIGLRNELSQQQLQIIPVKGLPVKSVWNMIWLVDKKLSPVAMAFLQYVRKEKARIIKSKFEWFEQYV
jgi:DNA-binding transcriptional LysR family regulator